MATNTPDLNTAENKLAQLRTLLTMMYGVGQPMFEQIGEQRRDHLVWLASDLANEVHAALYRQPSVNS